MKKIYFIVFLILSVNFCYTQDLSKEHQANYIFGFARLMQWPQYDNNELVVNVFGETVVTGYLELLSKTNLIGGKKLVVNKANLITVDQCNILYITSESINFLPQILNNIENKSVLIITETPNMTNRGADISFELSQIATGDIILSYSFDLNSINRKRIKYTVEFIGFGMIDNHRRIEIPIEAEEYEEDSDDDDDDVSETP